MSNLKYFTIYFIRHGKVVGTPAIYGSTDVDIEPINKEPVKRFVEKYEIDSHFKLISSPLKRCIKTCDVFNEFIKSEHETEILENLKELDFGELDGLPFDQYTNEQIQLLNKITLRPSRARIRESETLREFKKRVTKALNTVVGRHENLVVFSHCGTMKMIFAILMGLSIKKDQLWVNLVFNYMSVLKYEGVFDPETGYCEYKITLMPSVSDY